jgi:hypothetical protein
MQQFCYHAEKCYLVEPAVLERSIDRQRSVFALGLQELLFGIRPSIELGIPGDAMVPSCLQSPSDGTDDRVLPLASQSSA